MKTFARVIDANGEIWDVTDKLSDLSGYSGAQLLLIDVESYNTQIGNPNYSNCEQFFKLVTVVHDDKIEMNLFDPKSTENRFIIHSEIVHGGPVGDPEILWQSVIKKLIESGDSRLAIISSVRKGGSVVQ